MLLGSTLWYSSIDSFGIGKAQLNKKDQNGDPAATVVLSSPLTAPSCHFTHIAKQQGWTIKSSLTGLGKCPFLGILNITFKYLLDIISPVVGWCSIRTFTNSCLRLFTVARDREFGKTREIWFVVSFSKTCWHSNVPKNDRSALSYMVCFYRFPMVSPSFFAIHGSHWCLSTSFFGLSAL